MGLTAGTKLGPYEIQAAIGAGGMEEVYDGRELFYVAPDARLMAVPIGSGPNNQIEPGAPVALFTTRLARGANVVVAGGQQRAQYAVAADGRFLMNVSVDEATASPITIVMNWDAQLKK